MTSQLLNLNLDNIATYNDHGAVLAEAIRSSDIAATHHPVILGLFAVYSILVAIGHFNEDEIIWPPHSIRDFSATEWLATGLDPVVVSIAALLPYPGPKARYDPWHIAPEAMALSYLGGPKLERAASTGQNIIAQRIYDFAGNGPTPQNHIRLTDGGRDGNNYIYDTATGKMINLNMYAGFGYDRKSYTEANELFFPIETVMRNWVRNLYDLKYTPNRLGGWTIETRVLPEVDCRNGEGLHYTPSEMSAYFWDGPTWYTYTMYMPTERRIEANRVMSMRKIYKTYGWPDEFDKEACWQAMEQFDEKRSDLEREVHKAMPLSFHDDPPPWPATEAPRAVLEAFLEETAGDFAIKRIGKDEL